VKSHDDLAVAI